MNEQSSEIIRTSLPEMTESRREIWASAQDLPCTLTLEVPIEKFTIEALLGLAPGSVIESLWNQAIDLPLRANGEVIGWTEFEVVGDRLAVRVTELE